ncbi:MAG TPA: hypothetical protein VG939_20500 [Caulobacteraceae bacterium]|nr:hypothetical protein [Caulobacteraceae bacterium]
MKLVELTAVKGGPVWVNAGLVLYVSGPDGAAGGANMYGDNNVRTSSRVWFGQGASLEVKEAVGEVVARLGA